MNKTRFLLLLVLAGCMTDVEGDPGAAGPPGEPGPAGPSGSGLVWKDATGAVVPNSFVLYEDRRFVMLVRDEKGVFFNVSPMSGAFTYPVAGNGGVLWPTNNCTGPAHRAVDVAPNTAFDYNGRIVVLPPDVEVATMARSYSGTNGCAGTNSNTALVPSATLDALPTVTPPSLRPGPYHVEQR